MLDKESIDIIEEKIGYTFNNKAILSRAFMHNSASHLEGDNYQRLEFLGDSILDFVIAEELMKRYPKADEGDLTQMRAAIVSKEPLATTIKNLGLNKFLIVGKGERKSNVNQQKKVESDIFEALVAGIYIDSNMENATKFILKLLKTPIDRVLGTKKDDYKSLLNEYASRHEFDVRYDTVQIGGEPHDPTFESKLYIDDVLKAEGISGTKKAAEQSAAEKVVKNFK